MPDGNGERPYGAFGQSLEDFGLAKDLSGFDKQPQKNKDTGDISISSRALFLTLSNFMDDNEAMAYAKAMARCLRHKMLEQLEELRLMCYAKVGVKGRGRDDIIDVLTQFQEIKEREESERRKSAAKPQRSGTTV